MSAQARQNHPIGGQGFGQSRLLSTALQGSDGLLNNTFGVDCTTLAQKCASTSVVNL